MSIITNIPWNQNVKDSREVINTNFDNLNNGKQENLSEWPFVDWDKTKLDWIETGAEVNVWEEYTTAEKAKVVNVPADTNTELSGKQETLVNQTNIKSINWDTLLGSWDLIVSAGSGWFASDLYLSDTTSTVNWAYKQLDYTPDVASTFPTIVCNNWETAWDTYLFELDIDTSIIDAGKWTADFYASVNNISAGDTFLRYEPFVRASWWAETVLFSTTSPVLTTTPHYVDWESEIQGTFVVNPTDKYWIKVYAFTTANQNRTVTYTVGNGNASFTNTPLATRHSQLRGRDLDDQHPISAITGLQVELDTKVVSTSIDYLRVTTNTTLTEWYRAVDVVPATDNVEITLPDPATLWDKARIDVYNQTDKPWRVIVKDHLWAIQEEINPVSAFSFYYDSKPFSVWSKVQIEGIFTPFLDIADYWDFNDVAWATVPPGLYTMTWQGSQFSNYCPEDTLTPAANYIAEVEVRNNDSVYEQEVIFTSDTDTTNILLGRESRRIWKTHTDAISTGWKCEAFIWEWGGWAVSVINTFTQAGTIVSWTYWTWNAGQAGTMTEFNAAYLTAPTGTAATIEVFKNDVSMWTITITAGSWTQATLTGWAYVKFDKFHYVVTEGWTIAWAGLTVNAVTS